MNKPQRGRKKGGGNQGRKENTTNKAHAELEVTVLETTKLLLSKMYSRDI